MHAKEPGPVVSGGADLCNWMLPPAKSSVERNGIPPSEKTVLQPLALQNFMPNLSAPKTPPKQPSLLAAPLKKKRFHLAGLTR